MALEVARAVSVLLPASRHETLYAMAVLACRLGRVEEARKWLGEAMTLGGKEMDPHPALGATLSHPMGEGLGAG